MALLKAKYVEFAGATLEEEAHQEAKWAEVVALSVEVVADVNDAAKRLNPGAKGYTTPYDGVLSS